MIFGAHLSVAVERFNAGLYPEACQECEKYLQISPGDLPAIYLGALASQNLGDFTAAKKFLLQTESSASDSEVAALSAHVDQSIDALAHLPSDVTSGSWYPDKTVLRIGGKVRLIDRLIDGAQKVLDTNATAVRLGRPNRVDILRDAHQIPEVESASVDLVASSHTIEHLVNPLLALTEWHRTLRQGGYIYSVVPNYVHTFDHRRQLTDLEHLIADMKTGSTDPDWHHIVEFLRNHDCDRDLVFRGDKQRHFDEFMKAPHLHTHYHVFDLPLVFAMHEYCGFKTLACFESEISIHYAGIKRQ
jgi:SAM-dependent methyltransferase